MLHAQLLALWRTGAENYEVFQRDFHTTGAVTTRAKAALREAAAQLGNLARYSLGSQREFMLYGRLQDVYAPLARDDTFCADAANWAIQRAVHPAGSSVPRNLTAKSAAQVDEGRAVSYKPDPSPPTAPSSPY